ncbi:hypothetical protein JG687_00000179 [Phytophthora cactorum]|uniref:Uncharacterized protein n=1 Tax=Phytophthora cactorum TaxID=29920 RepID=A0A8T1V3L0_9STRA|nr:hypothetical protein JG687_00000179 [Phytophthora cactorum]
MRKHQLARTSCSRNRILRLEKLLAAAPHDYPIPVAGEISCLLNTNAVVLTSTVNYDMNTNSCKSAYVTTAVGPIEKCVQCSADVQGLRGCCGERNTMPDSLALSWSCLVSRTTYLADGKCHKYQHRTL